MEFTKLELAIIEKTEGAIGDPALAELNDLQLAMVGGGVGEVILG